MIKTFAMLAMAISLGACSFFPKPEVPLMHTELVAVGIDRATAQQCIGRIHRGDVPTVPDGHARPLDSDTGVYIRKLEDGYEICERVVREGLAAQDQLHAQQPAAPEPIPLPTPLPTPLPPDASAGN